MHKANTPPKNKSLCPKNGGGGGIGLNEIKVKKIIGIHGS
jgi:hypothetical protein